MMYDYDLSYLRCILTILSHNSGYRIDELVLEHHINNIIEKINTNTFEYGFDIDDMDSVLRDLSCNSKFRLPIKIFSHILRLRMKLEELSPETVIIIE